MYGVLLTTDVTKGRKGHSQQSYPAWWDFIVVNAEFQTLKYQVQDDFFSILLPCQQLYIIFMQFPQFQLHNAENKERTKIKWKRLENICTKFVEIINWLRWNKIFCVHVPTSMMCLWHIRWYVCWTTKGILKDPILIDLNIEN